MKSEKRRYRSTCRSLHKVGHPSGILYLIFMGADAYFIFSILLFLFPIIVFCCEMRRGRRRGAVRIDDDE